MPYSIVARENQYCVVKDEDSTEMGCHDTRADAEAQIAALYANESADPAPVDPTSDKTGKTRERFVSLGSAIKSYGKSEDGREIIGGYLAVWGTPEQRDLHGEYFTRDTNFDSPYKAQPVLYHHGLSPEIGLTPIGEIISLVKDATGLRIKAYFGLQDIDMAAWTEEQKRQYNEYLEAIKHLMHKDVLRWSGGALPQGAYSDDNGFIRAFPIIEGSQTFSPAEPSQATRVIPMKSLPLNTLKDLLLRVGKEAAADNGTTETQLLNPNHSPSKDTKDMNAQEICAAVIAKLREAGIDIPSEMEAALMEQFTPMAEEIAAEAKAESDDEQMTEEEKTAAVNASVDAIVKAITPKVKQQLKDFQRASLAQRAATKAAAVIAGGLPASRIDGLGSGQAPSKNNPVITLKSRRWANLDAADMSYWLCLQRLRNHNKNWQPPSDLDFYREIGGKTLEGYNKGKIRFPEDADETVDVPRAIKSAHNMKANELDHSTQAGFGDEWVPDLWASQIWELMRLDNLVAPTIQIVEMPSNPFELPIETTDPTVYFVPETTAESELLISGAGSVIPDSKLATDKVQLSAKKLALRVGYSMEVDEDSIIPFANQLRTQAQRAILDAIDNVIINGDNTTAASGNINSDDGAPAATAKYLAFDGIRHLPLVTTTTLGVNGGGASPTLTMIRSARFKMRNAYALRPDGLRLVCDSSTYAKLLNLDEFITMEKAGALATAQKGVIGFVDGIAVLPSAEMALTEADGKINTASPSATLFGQIVLYAMHGWHLGYRRRVVVNVDYLSYYDSYQLTATVRLALAKRANDCASVIYNLAV